MARAKFITERESERDYKLEDSRVITLKISDDLTQITFWFNQTQLGKDDDFCFKDFEDGYLLSRMYVPIKQMGLGRAALEFFITYTKQKIYARMNDGIKRDDGSHLTGDALGFVYKMRKEGLIQKITSVEPEEDSW